MVLNTWIPVYPKSTESIKAFTTAWLLTCDATIT